MEPKSVCAAAHPAHPLPPPLRCTSCLKYLDLSDSQSAKKKVLAIQTGFAKMVKKCNHRNLKIHEKYWNLNNCFFIFIGWRLRIKWASQCISFKLHEIYQISKDTMLEGYQRWLRRCQGYQVSLVYPSIVLILD